MRLPISFRRRREGILAVALIALYAAALVGATVVESTHGAAAARLRVYDTWWFAALNVLVAASVFWAMLVRFPWRRRQAGFVVTHAGVLVLLAGCLATWRCGVDAQLPIFEGRAAHLAYEEDSGTVDLGFQVYLRKFQRKLDPGSDVASHYSSLVDFLDRSNPPKKLRENVLITLNAPVDFTDPRCGRTYRLFQSGFQGPWLPGDPEFERLTDGDRSRRQVYLSRLSVNYDPGRGLKYVGSLMVVLGIGIVYYMRGFGVRGSGLGTRDSGFGARGSGFGARGSGLGTGGSSPIALFLVFIFASTACVCRAADRAELDWSTWQRLPTFGEGRVAPLDTFARETVEAICGRSEPTLVLENDQRRKFTAAELLFYWLAEPEMWENIPFLAADDEQLREEVLELPLRDKTGRRLLYASPVEVENSTELARRWVKLRRWANAEGKNFRLTDLDRKIKNLVDAYARYRMLTLYHNGGCLRLVPALRAAALEADRTPEEDASPWLGFQAMIFGPADLLRAYPQAELRAVREAFAELKANTPPLRCGGVGQRQGFAAAMERFAKTLRALGEKIEPLREKLPIRHRDQELIRLTAYPPAGSTEAEVFYNRLDPFFWSWAASLAAMLCLLLAVGRWQKSLFWLGVAVLVVAQGFTAAGLGLRAYVTGLVPLTGMFETVVVIGLYAALLGLWFALLPLWTRGEERGARDEGWAIHCPLKRMDRVLRRRPFALSGAIVSFLAAVLAYYAPATVMHRQIGAVAPILRDNFWLAVHVLTIMAGYASGAIALILGNIALGYYLFGRYDASRGRRSPEACSVLAGFSYTAIQITVLLLAAGTALGALWADQAWGRFWAWDPKEVWALISLLAYLLILHMRHVGWSGDFGMIVAAVLGFTAILFTWYGVNFLLGSGMHSYGAGSGGQWAVAAAVVLEWSFLAAAAVRYRMEQYVF